MATSPQPIVRIPASAGAPRRLPCSSGARSVNALARETHLGCTIRAGLGILWPSMASAFVGPGSTQDVREDRPLFCAQHVCERRAGLRTPISYGVVLLSPTPVILNEVGFCIIELTHGYNSDAHMQSSASFEELGSRGAAPGWRGIYTAGRPQRLSLAERSPGRWACVDEGNPRNPRSSGHLIANLGRHP